MSLDHTIPIDYSSNPIQKTPGKNAAYLKMRRDHARAQMREIAAGVTGQGCADVYPNGYPLNGGRP